MSLRGPRASVLIGWVVLSFAGPLFNGCMVGPDFHPPQTIAPSQWAGIENKPTEPYYATGGAAALTRWWDQFNDPQLTALVEEGLRANLDIRIAQARLREAGATRAVTAGALWPSFGASAGYQRVHTAGVTPSGQTADLFQSGLNALWQLDFFGGQRRNIESADANIHAAIEGIRDAQVNLIAEIALNYIQLRGFQQEIAIAQENLISQKHTAEITHRLLKAGFDSALDVANADSNVATTEAQIPVFEISARQAIYALSVLLGRTPAELLERLDPSAPLPGVPTQIPAGLPSDLLRRRPDIRQAEAKLHAATAQIGAAVSELFPSFSLTGSVTWNSHSVASWWSAGSGSFGIGPSVTWPIFQGGAIVANIRLQEALRDEAFVTYQKSVLAAFQEVEDALIAFSREQDHHRHLYDATVANRKAVELSLLLYSAGQTDFLNVLTAQKSLYSSQDALVQSDEQIAADLITLFKALGGGWDFTPSRSSATPLSPVNSSRGTKGEIQP